MSTLTDLEEAGICVDITQRMAIFAMAKALDNTEIAIAFDQINKTLIDSQAYEEESINKFIKIYRDATITINDQLK